MPHEEFMRAALRLAIKGLGRTSPNPAVGAVIVKNGQIASTGYHRKAGGPHAEIEALAGAGRLKGATVYVTLEPCCHFGRTPPCTEALIRSGVKRVVVGASDPNPRVSGKGIRALRRAGIEVIAGILRDECAALNEPYNTYIRRRTPFVTLKLASSLDGRIATSSGSSKWITGVEARKSVHRLRSLNDAVMVGRNTVKNDDPELTVRLVRGSSPVRVVLDSLLETAPVAKVFNGVKEGKARLLIFASKEVKASRVRKAEGLGAEVILVQATGSGLSLGTVMRELGKREITSVLVEGGSELAASFISAGLVDKYVFFYGPMLIGGDGLPMIAGLKVKGLVNAPRLERVKATTVGSCLAIVGYPAKRKG
ncbi:MAG TPA: bifunctional diaminohydroxyphosphoribosylaminopyrimidine deaminase/5-amino-6-(5-phosphoribosylamino)uracil reductase RibD [Deltaproteobacteria bacterium]|nr:MAG: riboflavin biosynthesis protein RibD [Deltaproteobacteria bacterium GWA2_55_82]OIJ74778.1 MAG: riboflavin biosynthesis protein RibD [Deltaproteobacteria bacterium GWC2_55_46]HBG45708.1 bifunctional diaminohydroxyphosphoribosylaminopyrimidine deaminase/5-amino-6-(5-phosphoribosylamino)uracil reductase RibD [Deltaproteobacteria bacterium]HCY11116.1 bifunctional diaminohydroxyphosphoribosylaminopyrimidine deaminase/5-amino-6-(5-phosphoribosylamino)uracil reductase RibD [Deltaproteobacteria 